MANNSVFEIDASGKEWRHVPGYEGIYVVSEYGEVKRICPGAGRARKGAILRPGRNPKGYSAVNLAKGGVNRTKFLHVLVCEVFHGDKPSPIHQAAHRDDDKDNNHRDNLYWATPLENQADRRRNGRIPMGSQIRRATLTEEGVLEMHAMHKKGISNKVISEKFGVARHTVSRVLNWKRWGHLKDKVL